MTSDDYLKTFNKIYDATYFDLLRFIIIKCHNVNDANDIIQEVYIEFWKILHKKRIDEKNIKSFLIGIAINKIKKHYTFVQRFKMIFLLDENKNIDKQINIISNDIDIEKIVIKKEEWKLIWHYIKKKKNQNIPKIFYLYYVLDLSIKEIANALNLGESYVKNCLYRTLKELYSLLGKECN